MELTTKQKWEKFWVDYIMYSNEDLDALDYNAFHYYMRLNITNKPKDCFSDFTEETFIMSDWYLMYENGLYKLYNTSSGIDFEMSNDIAHKLECLFNDHSEDFEFLGW